MSADPLELLRQFTIEERPIEFLDKAGNLTTDLLQAETVRFGEDASFPRDTPTRYLRGNSDADQYPLSALLYFFSHRDQPFYEYMKTSSTVGLQTVSFNDRAGLLDYLTGKTDKVAADSSAGAGEKHANSDAEGDGRRTRLRTDELASTATGPAAGKGGLGTESASDAARSIARRERTLVNPSTALSSNKSFAHVSDLIKELFPAKSAVDAKGKPLSSATAASSGAAGSKAGGGASRRKTAHRKRRDPIIVVPAAATAMVNMYNIKNLLQDHEFVDSRAMLERGGEKPREILVEHAMPSTGQNMRFRVVDSVQDFSEADWNSLVCVFTQGAAWQFKNWIWGSPEEVFQNCMGLYPKHQDEQPKDSTRTWGISLLNIERNKRHMDRATVAGLWVKIEQYMARNKPDFFA